MNKKRFISIICLFAYCLTGLISVAYATDIDLYDGDVYYNNYESSVRLRGSVQDITEPVTVIVSKKDSLAGKDSDIVYISQFGVKSDGSWEHSLTVKGNIMTDYDILLRQDNNVNDSVKLEELKFATNKVNAKVAADMIDEMITAHVTIKNPLCEEVNVTIYVAMYNDDDNLVSVIPVNLGDLSDYETREKTINCILKGGASYSKVFVWTSDLVPLTEGIIPTEKTAVENSQTILSLSSVESKEPITKNPGKGWIRYGERNYTLTGSEANSELDTKAIEYSSIGYMRYDWAELQPNKPTDTDDGIDWNRIEKAIDYWDKLGMKFAFRVMTTDTTSSGAYSVVPKWVYDEGVPYVDIALVSSYENLGSGTTRVPDYRSAKYLELYGNFLKALGDRYDGDPRISYIDLGGYGNTGEYGVQNMAQSAYPDSVGADGKFVYAVNKDEMLNIVKLHTDAFAKTQLLVAEQAINGASNRGNITAQEFVAMGIGFRNDFGYSALADNMALFNETAPAVDEMGPPYDNRVNMYGAWDNRYYMEYIKHHNFSYLALGDWSANAQHFIRDQEDAILYLTNKMGYHLVLENVSVPSYVGVGREFDVTLNIKNDGLAYIYEPCNIKLALLDRGNNIVKLIDSSISLTKNIKGGESMQRVIESVSFGNEKDGSYKLAMGLFYDNNDNIPDYQIGNYGSVNNWYVIANAVKEDTKYTFTPYLYAINADGKTVAKLIYGEKEYISKNDALNISGINIASSDEVTIDGLVYVSLDTVKNLVANQGGTVVTTENATTIKSADYMALEVLAAGTITNPGFESSLNSWIVSDAATVSTDTTSVTEGTKSLKLISGKSGSVSTRFKGERQKLYTLSFDAKGESPVTVSALDENGKQISSCTVTPGSSWKTCYVNFDLFDAGEYVFADSMYDSDIITLEIRFDTLTSDVFVDNLCLEAVSYSDIDSAGDLIKDYNNETGLFNWKRHNGKVERSADCGYSDSTYSGKITGQGQYNGAAIYNYSQYAINSLTSGNYKFSSYMRSADSQTIGNFFDFGASNGVSVYAFAWTSPETGELEYAGKVAGYDTKNVYLTDRWKLVEGTITLTETQVANIKAQYAAGNEVYARIGFQADWSDDSGNGKVIYFDNVSLTKN